MTDCVCGVKCFPLSFLIAEWRGSGHTVKTKSHSSRHVNLLSLHYRGQWAPTTWFSYLTANIWAKWALRSGRGQQIHKHSSKKEKKSHKKEKCNTCASSVSTMREMDAVIHVNKVMRNSYFKQKWFVSGWDWIWAIFIPCSTQSFCNLFNFLLVNKATTAYWLYCSSDQCKIQWFLTLSVVVKVNRETFCWESFLNCTIYRELEAMIH